MSAELVRKRVIYSGRVQGVGFRASTQAISSRFRVTGFVRNLADGTVELEAEGVSGELDQFLLAVEQRLARNITQTHVSELPSEGTENRFSIRR